MAMARLNTPSVNLIRKRLLSGVRFLLLAIVILAALYVSAGRIAINGISYFQDNLTGAIGTALKVETRLGQLSGHWNRFDPTVELKDLVLGDPENPVIVLDKVSFRLSSLLSLAEMDLIFTEVSIKGIRLQLIELVDGGWQVEGLPKGKGQFNYQPLLDFFTHVEHLTLEEVEIGLSGLKASYEVRDEENSPLQISRAGAVRSLSLPLIVEKLDTNGEILSRNRMYLLGDYTGDPRNTSEFGANLYLEVPGLRLSDFLATVEVGNYEIDGLEFSLVGWLKYNDGNLDLLGQVRSGGARFTRDADDQMLIDGLALDFRLSGSREGAEVQLIVPDLQANLSGQPVKLSDVNILAEQTGGKFVVAATVPTLDLVDLHSAISALNETTKLMPERAMTALDTMAPRGEFVETTLLFDDSGELPEIRLNSNIRGVSVNAYLGAPSISTLNGFVSLGPKGGYIDVNNGPYEMQFTPLFRSSWPFESARGRVNYFFREGILQFNSGLIELKNGELSAHGKLHLNLPPQRSEQTWGLIVGISNADLLDAGRYLPTTLSPELVSWLDKSVLAGNGSESGLVFHGSLFRGAPKIRKVNELYFKVDRTVLNYDENWPVVSDLDATIYINNRGVFSDDATGSIFDSQITESRVHIAIPPEGKVDTINIEGRLLGPLRDGIRVLNETPLAVTTNHMASAWQGEGNMLAQAKLGIPIGPRTGEPTYADVTVFLNNNDIEMPAFDLTAFAITGDVRYETLSGLTSPQFTAMLFNEPVAGRINSRVGGDSGEITVSVDGHVAISDLYDWSSQVLLTRATGAMDYQAEIHIPYGGDNDLSYVEARSSLQGVQLDIPTPLRKTSANTSSSMRYRQTFVDDGYRLDFDLADTLKGSLRTRDGIVRGGRLHFGAGKAGVISFEKVRVTGHLDYADYEQWSEFIASLDQVSEVSLESEMANAVEDIVVDVDLLNLYSLELPNADLNIKRVQGGWRANLTNINLQGVVSIPDKEGVPLGIDLEYLRFFPEEGDDPSEDPFAGVVPQEMLAIDFSTEELFFAGENYGKWKFNFRPTSAGATLDNIAAHVKGMEIVSPSAVTWNYSDDTHDSSFDGNVKVVDLAVALQQWGFASSIEGRDFGFVSKLAWPGSPAMIDLDIVKGTLAINGKGGRFVQAETGTAALKLLGIFDFNQLGRRLSFDFSDVVDSGYQFDKITGTAAFESGIIEVTEPILIVGSGSNFKIGGTVDINTRILDNDMIVTLPVGKNLPWYAAYSAIVTGPLVGAGVFLAQKVFEKQINQMSSAKYKVSGTLDEPIIEFVEIFSDSVRGVEAPPALATEPESPEAVRKAADGP